jgi:hypothetical protein
MKGLFQIPPERMQRWPAPLCIALIVLVVAVAVHVHPGDFSDARCVVCVAAHTSTPVAFVTTQVTLIAIASLPVIHELTTPESEAVLPLFIRPPPSA